MPENFDKDYKALLRQFGPRLWLTSAFAAGVSVCAVALLGLSGWFLTAAAVAGAGGPVAVQAFNSLLPSAFIRFFAIGRTVLRYGERYLGHSAALRAMADLRPALFARLLGQRRGELMRLSRGEASSRFVQDVGALENRLVVQSAPASAAGGVVMALLMCGWASPWGALILLAFMAAALGAALYIHRRLPEADAASEQAAIGALKARFYELSALLPDVRAYDLRAPLMTELRERYKDDKKKLNQGMMELYKREKVNPAAGCLPIFVQIPVFFSLYKVLFVTIEMRHAPFFGWIHDLSAPDPTSFINLFGLLPFGLPQTLPGVLAVANIVLHIGVWPILMGVTQWLQTKLNPAPADAMQAKMFAFMPVIMIFMLASFPAGLVIYWTWNNLLSVGQQYLMMRRQGVPVHLVENMKMPAWLTALKLKATGTKKPIEGPGE